MTRTPTRAALIDADHHLRDLDRRPQPWREDLLMTCSPSRSGNR
nr:hypothetical protein OH837_43900 [Streptomyces canus]